MEQPAFSADGPASLCSSNLRTCFPPACRYAPAVRAWERSLTPPLNSSYDVYRWYVRGLVNDVIHARLGRTAMGWADIDDAFPDTYASDNVIVDVWTGFYSGNWQDDVGALAAKNASIIVSGPFYVSATDRSSDYPHQSWHQMYATDLSNFTGATPALLDRVLGGELTAWGDAAQCDSGNVFTVLTPEIFAVAESWWSPRSVTSGQNGDNAQPRMELHRCRVGARGVPSNTIYDFSNTDLPFGGECPYAEFSFSPLPL